MNKFYIEKHSEGGGGDGIVTDALMLNIFMVDVPTISNECLGLKFHGDGLVFRAKNKHWTWN